MADPGLEPRGIPRLHLVTDTRTVSRPDFLARSAAILKVGGEGVALHLRAPGLASRLLHEYALVLASAARRAGSVLLVNGHVDVALAAGANGAQMGGRGIPPARARAILGKRRFLGVSVHSRGEAEVAAAAGADFLLAGTLYETASHPGRPGAGPALIEELHDLGVPLIGIGGITPERVAEVVGAGARGVAVLRGVWEVADPAEALEGYLQRLGER